MNWPSELEFFSTCEQDSIYHRAFLSDIECAFAKPWWPYIRIWIHFFLTKKRKHYQKWRFHCLRNASWNLDLLFWWAFINLFCRYFQICTFTAFVHWNAGSRSGSRSESKSRTKTGSTRAIPPTHSGVFWHGFWCPPKSLWGPGATPTTHSPGTNGTSAPKNSQPYFPIYFSHLSVYFFSSSIYCCQYGAVYFESIPALFSHFKYSFQDLTSNHII